MPLGRHISKGGRQLRLGIATGACAALAAGAATRLLLTGRAVTEASIVAPGGEELAAPLADSGLAPDEASCAVRKDAGDDPDITHGALVRATVRKIAAPDIEIDGGQGVGRVTKNGLDQPPGTAAINSTPRRMIADAVRKACRDAGYAGGIAVVISIPGGEELAAKTFNPQLGIVGGLSILGTTGVVEPMSDRAVVATIELELKMRRAEGAEDIVITPGNYGEAFIEAHPLLAARPRVVCSNFIGEALDLAGALGFRRVLVVGHAGKLVKLAGGIMDTHSRTADCRMELLALQAALAGAGPAELRNLLEAATVDAALDMLAERGILDAVMSGILERIDHHLRRRAAGKFEVGALLFSRSRGILGGTAGVGAVMSGSV